MQFKGKRQRMNDEEYIAIPISEYEYLKQCKERLIDLCKSEIDTLIRQINEQEINTIINSSINHPKQ